MTLTDHSKLDTYEPTAHISIPKVTMDINLREKFSSIEVNTHDLGRVMQSAGLNDEHIASERIHLTGDTAHEDITESPMVIHLGNFALKFSQTRFTRTEAAFFHGAEAQDGWLSGQVDMAFAQKMGMSVARLKELGIGWQNPLFDFQHLNPGYRLIRRAYVPDVGLTEAYKVFSDNPKEGLAAVEFVGDKDEILNGHPDGPLLRFHSECIYSHEMDSMDCDCVEQWDFARDHIYKNKSGILVRLMGQEGRGAGLLIKAEGYRLKETEGLDTFESYKEMGVEFDSREYGHVIKLLLDKGVTKVRLMSNNPRKIAALEEAGIKVTRIPVIILNDAYNDYLEIKRVKGGHLFPVFMHDHVQQLSALQQDQHPSLTQASIARLPSEDAEGRYV